MRSKSIINTCQNFSAIRVSNASGQRAKEIVKTSKASLQSWISSGSMDLQT